MGGGEGKEGGMRRGKEGKGERKGESEYRLDNCNSAPTENWKTGKKQEKRNRGGG